MASSSPPLTRDSVLAAHALIRSSIHETPVLTSKALNAVASTPQSKEALQGTPWAGKTPAQPRLQLFFKAENLQRIGAFKIRGATHALRRLSAAGELDPSKGVCTHSSGNHAQALALAAREAGVPAHVVMPGISTKSKIAATKGYGAHVVFSGSTEAERLAVLDEVIRSTKASPVPPFDHPDIILGQGTMAVELERQVGELVRRHPELSVHSQLTENEPATTLPQGREEEERQYYTFTPGKPRTPPQPGRLDAVIAPLGGGGMLSGNAVFFGPTPTLVFGAEPSFQGADDGRRGLAADPPKRIPQVSTLTIADGLRTPVGEIPWTVVSDRTKVEGVYAVGEEQIKASMRFLFERLKVVVEPSAAVPLAVILFDEDFRKLAESEGGKEGWDIGVVLSGGNTTVEAIAGLYSSSSTESKQRAEGLIGLHGEKHAENVPG